MKLPAVRTSTPHDFKGALAGSKRMQAYSIMDGTMYGTFYVIIM